MQDPASGFPRIPLPRTPVNKGKGKGRGPPRREPPTGFPRTPIFLRKALLLTACAHALAFLLAVLGTGGVCAPLLVYNLIAVL